MDQWVTQAGADLLPLEEEHCSVVEVTEEDIQNSVKFVPSLSAVVRNPDHHHRGWGGGGWGWSLFQTRQIMLILSS